MITLTVLACVAALLYYYLRRCNEYWRARGVRGPRPDLLFGNFRACSLHREEVPVALERLYHEYATEKVVGVYRLTKPALLLRDLDVIKHVMIKDFDSFEDRGVSLGRAGLAANLFMADAALWRALRQRLTPLFTSGKLRRMLPLLAERSDRFLTYAETAAAADPAQEVHALVQLYTVTTIAACAFGLDLDPADRDAPLLRDLRRIDDLVFTKSFVKEIIYLYPHVFQKFNVTMFSGWIGAFFRELVARVTAERGGRPSTRNDFVDLLLELRCGGEVGARGAGAGEPPLEITDDVMAAQAFICYVAGYETSATTMTFMLYELARNPDVQAKLQAEVDEVLARHGGRVTSEALGELPYMEQVMAETLRMYPVLDPLQRAARREYRVPGTGVLVERGTVVLVPVTALHRDPALYPDPARFDPERFGAAAVAARHACAYLPFGLGPRNCIGMRFAKLQSRVCMVKLLSRFRVELADHDMVMDVSRAIVAPRRGYRLRFLPRETKT